MNKTPIPRPRPPTQLPEYAEICAHALVANELGEQISIGGAVGLMHYFEYRSTYDLDAWWSAQATTEEQQKVISVLETTLQPFGPVRIRRWGDVTSIELLRGKKKIFSFQIAHRSAQLEPSIYSSWPGILLDSFTDLVANKMVALVERGAPRDLLDIYTLCHEGLITPSQCWQLWRRRLELIGENTDPARAKLAVQTHVTRIAKYRPLEKISDPAARASAARVRTWFKTEFLDALS